LQITKVHYDYKTACSDSYLHLHVTTGFVRADGVCVSAG